MAKSTGMPGIADVVIIGGGIIGCMTSYYTALTGASVVLIERKGPASESSGANYGMIWQQTGLPGWDVTMRKLGLKTYPRLIDEVFDIDIEFEKRGGMTVFFSEIQKEAAELFCSSKCELGIPIRLLNSKEVRELEPMLSTEIMGATYCEEEAQLNPLNTTFAFARAARKEGARIVTGSQVTGLSVSRENIHRVYTDRGTVSSKWVVNAAGSWAAEIGAMAGIRIPVYGQRLQSIVTEQVPRLVSRVIQGARPAHSREDALKSFSYVYNATTEKKVKDTPPPQDSLVNASVTYIKPTISGNLVLGTACDFAGHDRSTTYEGLALIAARTCRTLPALKEVNMLRSWANFDPWTVDGAPVIGCTGIGGFLVAAGHGTGFSTGIGTARSIADYISRDIPFPFHDEVSLDRFYS